MAGPRGPLRLGRGMADQVMTLREGGRGRRAQDWHEELRHPRGQEVQKKIHVNIL